MSVKELKQEIEELKKEVQRLEDENSSLWFLMGELEKSNIANPEYQKQFLKVFQKIRHHNLMTHNRVEDA